MGYLHQAVADLQAQLVDAARREKEARKEQRDLRKALNLLKEASDFVNGHASSAPASEVSTPIINKKLSVSWYSVYKTLLSSGPQNQNEVILSAMRKQHSTRGAAYAALKYNMNRSNIKKSGKTLTWVE